MAQWRSPTCQPVSVRTIRPPWCSSWNECTASRTRASCSRCWRSASCLTSEPRRLWTRWVRENPNNFRHVILCLYYHLLCLWSCYISDWNVFLSFSRNFSAHSWVWVSSSFIRCVTDSVNLSKHEHWWFSTTIRTKPCHDCLRVGRNVNYW